MFLSSHLVDGESCSERYNPDIVEEENHQNNIPEKFIRTQTWKALFIQIIMAIII